MWKFLVGIIEFKIWQSLKPKPEAPPVAGTVEAPTATEGASIPVLFGTREIKGPNVVWYGDVKTVAIKKKGGKK